MGFIDLPKIAAALREEWTVITGAPWLFSAALLMASLLIWAFLWLLKRQQVANLKSQTDTLQTQVAYHKDRVEVLEAQVGKLEEKAAKPASGASAALEAIAQSGVAHEAIRQLVPERTVQLSASPVSDPSTWDNTAQFSPNDIRMVATINQLMKHGGVVVNQLPSHQYTATGTASLTAVSVGGGALTQDALDALRNEIVSKGLSTSARKIEWGAPSPDGKTR